MAASEWRYDTYQKRIGEGDHELSVFPRDESYALRGTRLISQLLLRLFLRAYNRLSFIGADVLGRVPRPCVVVANHSSHFDALVLLAGLPLREVQEALAVAAKDYFFSSMWKGLASVSLLNALPFDRKVAKAESLELCADALRAGSHLLIMFPEGTRSPDGALQPFKWGIGKLVAGTSTPVVPAYIEGAAKAWPKGRALPRPRKVRVLWGAPRTFEGEERSEAGWRRVAAALEADVRRLAAEGRA